MTATLPVEEVFSHALRGEDCFLTAEEGTALRVPVEDWTRAPDRADQQLLALCAGPTLDVGCGPGRLTAELAARGQVVLGIDLVSEAVAQTRGRGGSALLRSVFDPVPGEGRWETALVADGNVGIGGDPAALLHRIRRLLAPGGRVVAEVSAPGVRTTQVLARLQCPCGRSDAFPWSVVGADDVAELADSSGLALQEVRDLGGRWAAVLEEVG